MENYFITEEVASSKMENISIIVENLEVYLPTVKFVSALLLPIGAIFAAIVTILVQRAVLKLLCRRKNRAINQIIIPHQVRKLG